MFNRAAFLIDWRAMLDFADSRFNGLENVSCFDENPYPCPAQER